MSKTINLKSGAKRFEQFLVLPEEIHVEPKENGRAFWRPFMDLVVQILVAGKVHTPLETRKINDNKIQLVAGYRRHAASCFINAHLADGTLERILEQAGFSGVQIPAEPIRVPVTVENMNAKEAFLRNLSENRDRADTTVVDDAHNVRRLRDQYGFTDEEICKAYGTVQADGTVKPMSPAWLSQLRLILQHDEKTQMEIHEGMIAASSAQFLAAKIPEPQRRPVIERAKEIAAQRVEQIEAQAEPEVAKEPAPNNVVEMPAPVESKPAPKKKVASPKKKPATKKAAQVTHSDVVEAARQLGALGDKKVSRKMKDVRELFVSYQGPGSNSNCRKFCAAMLKFIDGEPESEELMDKEFKRRFKE
jgi:ParB-like chromosome segregation protein Spo0J